MNKYQNGKYAPKLQAPSNFLTVVNELRRICFPPDDFSVGYIRACRARAVEAFALTCAIQISKAPVGANSEVERSAGWDPLRTPEAVIKYLQGLGKMTWMEEAQMTMDVAQYDMHFVTLKPLEKFPPRSQNQTITLIGSETERVFTCKLVVKGSSESRPRICIGDKVRLRPTKEGLLYLNSACPRQVSMFELEGIILAYTLASETCIVEFVSPPREFFWANQLEPSDGVDIWSKITYQARFTFERSGLVFCHLAIADVLNTPGLRKSLFPTELFTAASQTESGSSKASSVGPPSPTRIESSNVTYSNVGSSLFASETSNSLFSSAFTSGPTSGAMPDTVGKSAGPPPGLSEIGVLGPLSGSPTQGKAQNFTSEYGDYYGQNSGTPMTDAETVSTPEVSVDTRFNEEQMTAIRSIVNLPEPNAFTTLPPYIIYGPPGTGKTSTLIEAIVRLHKKHPQKHVLACAPSDAAADVLVQRLKEFYKPSELLRHNWWQRISASVPIEIIQYTKANDAGVFEMPSFEEAKSFRIIVSTCGTAGSLMRLKPTGSVDALPTGTSPATPAALNPGYRALTFDLVVVDEASQATEAETYIPLSMCRSDGAGLMVLAGDPQQLGPMTRSSIFSIWGGPTSLQERMLSLPPYRIQEGTNGANTALNSLYGIGTQQSMVCFLTKNYRY